MARRYYSGRRKKAAAETHRDILQAALKLHWKGITEFEPLAKEAGCALATVRKHFPTKGALFQECTKTFIDSLTLPDIAALKRIKEPSKRLEESVSEICRIHESMFGYAWFSAYKRKEFQALDAVMSTYEELTDGIAEIISPLNTPRASLVRGLLDFLTYRALRLSGRLSPDMARDELIATLSLFAEASTSPIYNLTKKRNR
jgi:AcrR family transcriptional regulator